MTAIAERERTMPVTTIDTDELKHVIHQIIQEELTSISKELPTFPSEQTLRRLVQEEIHHSMRHSKTPRSIADDWIHEGPDDPEGDEALLQDALAQIEREKTHPNDRMGLDEFLAELDRAEKAGELPD